MALWANGTFAVLDPLRFDWAFFAYNTCTRNYSFFFEILFGERLSHGSHESMTGTGKSIGRLNTRWREHCMSLKFTHSRQLSQLPRAGNVVRSLGSCRSWRKMAQQRGESSARWRRHAWSWSPKATARTTVGNRFRVLSIAHSLPPCSSSFTA